MSSTDDLFASMMQDSASLVPAGVQDPMAGTVLFENALLQISLAFLVLMGWCLSMEVSAKEAFRDAVVRTEKERDGYRVEAEQLTGTLQEALRTPRGEAYRKMGDLQRSQQLEKLLRAWEVVHQNRPLHRRLIELATVERVHLSSDRHFLPDDTAFAELRQEALRAFDDATHAAVRTDTVECLLLEVWARAELDGLDRSRAAEAVRQAQAGETRIPTFREKAAFRPDIPSGRNLTHVAGTILDTLKKERREQLVPLQTRLIDRIALARLSAGLLTASASTDPVKILDDLYTELRAPLALLPEVKQQLVSSH